MCFACAFLTLAVIFGTLRPPKIMFETNITGENRRKGVSLKKNDK